jgi:putative DNA primase/helicase
VAAQDSSGAARVDGAGETSPPKVEPQEGAQVGNGAAPGADAKGAENQGEAGAQTDEGKQQQEHTEATDEGEFLRLAKLTDAQYERERKDVAKRLGMRPSILDKVVKSYRKGDVLTLDKLAFLEDPAPCDDPVDGAALLDALAAEFKRYLVLPRLAPEMLAVWVLHTYAIDAFDLTPYVLIKSPEPQCGKTTLIYLLEDMSRKALTSEGCSAAAIFRAVDKYRPTLLLDEADAWLAGNEDARGILNAGYLRGARILRVEGDEHEVTPFDPFGPKVISGISNQARTIESRSIPVKMKRKGRGETVERMRRDHFRKRLKLEGRASQCMRWALDNVAALRELDPSMPDLGNDRVEDNWRTLLAVADMAGGHWPQTAREAAKVFAAASADNQSIRTLLLSDIRELLSTHQGDAIHSELLASHLGAMVERPWHEWGRTRRPMTQSALARELRHFDIVSGSVRIGNSTNKGYHRHQFEDAFARYLPPVAPPPGSKAGPGPDASDDEGEP